MYERLNNLVDTPNVSDFTSDDQQGPQFVTLPFLPMCYYSSLSFII